MLKDKFLIQKSIVLSLALTGMVCAMDGQPKTSAEKKIEALREEPDSLFSKMPQDLDGQIGRYVLPNKNTQEKIEDLREEPGNLFSKMPKELEAQIGKHIVTFSCPTAEEMMEASNKHSSQLQFGITDAKTGLTFRVYRMGEGPYTFDSVDVNQVPNRPSLECHYKRADGQGNINARLYTADFEPRKITSCRGVSTTKPTKYYPSMYKYRTPTSDARDIAIECVRD